jgi:hypothetical protein
MGESSGLLRIENRMVYVSFNAFYMQKHFHQFSEMRLLYPIDSLRYALFEKGKNDMIRFRSLIFDVYLHNEIGMLKLILIQTISFTLCLKRR